MSSTSGLMANITGKHSKQRALAGKRREEVCDDPNRMADCEARARA